jgi:2-hydroxyglutarate dehydrogenase
VLVVDQAHTVGAHQTSHNSGVIHAGVYYMPGSLKARLCVRGAALMYDYCERHGIEAGRVGKLIIATEPAELPRLDELQRRATANGVPGIRRIEAPEIREIEPHATGLGALHSPNTGIVDFAQVSDRLAQDVQQHGGELRLAWPVGDVHANGRRIRLTGPGEDCIEASGAIFCAGLWADRLAACAGAPADPRIVPFRGGYLQLRPERRALVRGLIYPVPDPSLPFLGIHLTPQIGGDVVLGPSALLVGARDAYELATVRPQDLFETLAWPGTWRMMGRWWKTGLREIRLASSRRSFAQLASRYVPELKATDMTPGFAGVRAQAVGRDGKLIDDFVISRTPRAVHVRNAPSPAATSSLALAELIADTADEHLS